MKARSLVMGLVVGLSISAANSAVADEYTPGPVMTLHAWLGDQ